MKSIMKRLVIANCPVIEVVAEDRQNDKLPLIVYFHGFTNYKEKHLEQGYALANAGFRVVLPDAYLHGERIVDKTATLSQYQIWDVVMQSIKDLDAIHDYYESLILDDRFAIAGESMGGITTCCALTQFPYIRSAYVLMGAPFPVAFTKEALKGSDVDPDYSNAVLAKLELLDLSLNPEVLFDKPVEFWHDTDDKTLPYAPTKAWYEAVKDAPFAQKLSFVTTSGQGHSVRRDVIKTMVSYFEKNL